MSEVEGSCCLADGPMKVGGKTEAAGIERKGTGSVEGDGVERGVFCSSGRGQNNGG